MPFALITLVTVTRSVWKFGKGLFSPLLSRIKVTLASSVPHFMRSLSRFDLSVYACPRTTEIASRMDDLPAPLGPQIKLSPGSNGT